jgi:hypothetical protein
MPAADDHADRQADGHLQGEILRDPQAGAAVGGDVEQADHERDPDRVVHAGLALEDVVAAPAHLAAAQHREHHRGIGGRERRPDQERRCPAGTEQPVDEHRQQARH